MSANLDALVKGIRDKRSEKLPQAKARLEKLRAAKQAVLATRTRAAAVAAGNSDLQTKLGGISYDKTLISIDAAIEASERSVSRLSRESINIGVAGKARQGKSQILQMLTGLTDEQIPTGDNMPCTAARSMIHNAAMTTAKVYYLTKDGLLEKKVYPSYAPKGTSKFALGLTSRPSSLEAFLSMDLPPVDARDGTPTLAENNWEKVKDLQRDLQAHPELVSKLGADAEVVDIAHVRDYIVKDNGEVLHNVVDRVEIWTTFDTGLPEGLTVYDLPGLGDPSPGIREDMLESLKNEADVVLFMRKAVPDGEGEYWHDEDGAAFDDMKSVYSVEDVKPSEWIQLVLNLDTRVGHVNSRNTENLRKDGSKRFAKGFDPVVCDCGSKDAVRAMINENIERLVGNVARIDDLRIRQADESYEVAMSAVRSVADGFASAIGQLVAQSGGFDMDAHQDGFWADLRAPFKAPLEQQLEGIQEKIKNALKLAFGASYAQIKKIYDDYENDPSKKFSDEFPVFSRDRLVELLKGAHGTKEVIDRASRNQLSAVVQLLREELRNCCDELRRIYLRNVVQSVTKDNAAIQSLLRTASTEMTEKPEDVFKALANRLEEGGGSVETIVSALDNLLRFDVSYETQLLPYLFDAPEFSDKFDPYSPKSDLGELEKYLDSKHTGDFAAQADVLFNALKTYTLNWIAPLANSRSEGPCQEVSVGIMRVVMANYRNFIALFVWGEKTESEWKRYTRDNAATLWPEDFEKASAQSQIGRDLRDILAKMRQAAS